MLHCKKYNCQFVFVSPSLDSYVRDNVKREGSHASSQKSFKQRIQVKSRHCLHSTNKGKNDLHYLVKKQITKFTLGQETSINCQLSTSLGHWPNFWIMSIVSFRQRLLLDVCIMPIVQLPYIDKIRLHLQSPLLPTQPTQNYGSSDIQSGVLLSPKVAT